MQLWPQMDWHRHVVKVGMLGACLIVAFSVARPNPFSFGGANSSAFDPKRPGVVRITQHPFLSALALWAGLHLLPNGDLAHVVLFGVLGSFAIAGRRLINRRKRREIGHENWAALDKAVAKAPVIQMPLSYKSAVLRIALGLVSWVGLLTLHPAVLGVSAT